MNGVDNGRRPRGVDGSASVLGTLVVSGSATGMNGIAGSRHSMLTTGKTSRCGSDSHAGILGAPVRGAD